MQQFKWMSVGVLNILALCSAAQATDRWYVNAAASGGNGSSWAQAFQYLQDALEQTSGDDEIWVAQGTYYPPDGLASPPNDEREASFELQTGVAIYGGFAGGETSLPQRNPEKNPTVLSGDIGTPDDSADNSYHVVTADGVDNTSILSGFTIKSGFAEATGGGGMLLRNASPRIARCAFLDNLAGAGAGVFVDAEGSNPAPAFVNCSFLGNIADVKGGGMYATSHSSAVLDLRLHNCAFSGNVASELAGGALVLTRHVASSELTATLINCTITQNESGSGAGGIDSPDPSCPDGGFDLYLRNCILWHNGGTSEENQIDLDGSFCSQTTHTTNSCIQGLDVLEGNGNIGSDPLFCDASGPDDTPGTLDDNLRLQDGSPCLDAGSDGDVPADVADIDDDGNTAETLPWDRDNEKPLSQWGRFFDVASGPGGSVDMGAYENQHIADCPWDISSSGYTAPPDGDVGNPDFLMLIAEWGSCPGCGADFSCDGSVSSVDYNELLANWGSCPGGGDSPQGGGDSSLEEALEAMGFYDLADYQTWLSGATDEEAYASAVELALLLSE